MNKSVKKLLNIGVAAFLFSLIFGETVCAENELSNMTIEVELQEDGSGIVTEHRKMTMEEGLIYILYW